MIKRNYLLQILAVALLFAFGLTNAANQPANIAFYYGHEAPVGSLMAYDWVVLQQDQTSDARVDLLSESGTLPIAYVSIGEVARSHHQFGNLQKNWLIGKNSAWSSAVLDLRLPEVRTFLLDNLIDPAFERGFQGVFLDTLDSFTLAPDGEAQRSAFAEAQRSLISAIRARHPEGKIVLNRGFHLPDSIIDQVDGIALESWRNGYNAKDKRYYKVSDTDRQWLNGQLQRWLEARPDMPLIAIDYVAKFSQAGELADQLRSEGFVPWVANPPLDRLSPSQPAQVKRHVLVIHDLPPLNMDRSAAHRFGGIVLERSGFIPHYHSALEPLPTEPTEDRYAGILVWWETGDLHSGLCSWLSRQQDKGVPVVLMGLIPGNPACSGVMATTSTAVPTAPLNHDPVHPSVTNYEGGRLPSLTTQAIPKGDEHTPWLTTIDAQGQLFSPIYTHSRGGVASTPFLFETGPDDDAYWLFNPFKFIQQAFGDPAIPVIDTTTESGRRILTAHIDGDGFVSRGEFPGSPLSAQIIQDEILSRYEVPHTVSVIEAEVSPEGLYPRASIEAERIARAIFGINSVEVASHTYSHPFFWQSIEGGPAPRLENTLYGYFMNIPDYQASLEREIEGSVGYINQRLAPANKPVSVFLWTGDARPGANALKRVREAGLVNVNGGNTKPLPYASELADTWPDARPVGDELQVYAPVMNENVYTNNWTGPYYGFRNVTDTFRILEDKGRLKPIGIYYHFYSGTKPEALGALHEIYQYALEQPVTPLYLSDYAKRVQTLYYSALLRDEDGGWSWRGIGQPHTVKVTRNQFPDLEKSTGVAGFHDVAGRRYVHLTGNSPRLFLTDNAPKGPWLAHANGVLTQWKREQVAGKWQVTLGLQSHQNAEFTLAGTGQCTSNDDSVQITPAGGQLRVTLAGRQTESLMLECQ